MKALCLLCGIPLALLACAKPCPETVCLDKADDVRLVCPPGMDEFMQGPKIEGAIPCGAMFFCRETRCLICLERPKPLECPDGAKPAAADIPNDGGIIPDIDRYAVKYGPGLAICQNGACIYCKRHR